MPILLGRAAEECEEWFRELLRLRYPDIAFCGVGRRYVAKIDGRGKIEVQLYSTLRDYQDTLRDAAAHKTLLHFGLELDINAPAHWKERSMKGVITPERVLHDQSRFRGMGRLLRQIRRDGFEPDAACTCNFAQRREDLIDQLACDLESNEDDDNTDYDLEPCLVAEEKDMWAYHDRDCPVFVQGAIDDALTQIGPF